MYVRLEYQNPLNVNTETLDPCAVHALYRLHPGLNQLVPRVHGFRRAVINHSYCQIPFKDEDGWSDSDLTPFSYSELYKRKLYLLDNKCTPLMKIGAESTIFNALSTNNNARQHACIALWVEDSFYVSAFYPCWGFRKKRYFRTLANIYYTTGGRTISEQLRADEEREKERMQTELISESIRGLGRSLLRLAFGR